MLGLIFLFFIPFDYVESFDFAFGKPGKRETVFDKFGGTCGKRDLPIVIQFTGTRVENGKLLINCTFTVKEDIKKDPKLMIRMERCKNEENLDTCELFHVYTANSYCTTAITFADDFKKYFEPEWKCPIKKGVYRGKNAEIDISATFLFPVESWYWKILVQMLDRDTDKVLMCVITETHMRRL